MKQCFYGSKTNEPYAVYRGEQPLYGAKNEISGTGSITYMTTGLPVQVTEIKGNTVQDGTPSPDEPVEVQGVSERTANLIPFYRFKSENNGVKFTVNPDQSVTAIGTPTGLAQLLLVDRMPLAKLGLNPGDTVYLGWESTSTNLIAQIRGFDSEGNVVLERQTVGFPIIPDGTAKISIIVKRKTDGIPIDGNIKAILAKSSVAIPYEPYGYKIPVLNVGKNMIDESKLMYSYSLDATTGLPASVESTNQNRWAILKPFAVAPTKNYIISFKSKTTIFYAMYSVFDKSNRFVRRVTSIRSGTALDVSGGEYIYVALYCSKNGTREDFWDVQLEESDTVTPYEPYTATVDNIYLDEPLYGNTSNMDVIGVDDITKRWGIKVLDGTEPINAAEFATKGRIIVECNFGLELYRYKSFCTHYPYAATSSDFDKNKFFVYQNRFYFYPSGTEGITQDNLTATTRAYFASEYAKGTPVTIYYPLATPTTMPAVLPVISARKGTYTVTTDTAVKPSGMKITASGKQT